MAKITIRTIIEIAGFPKEHVEESTKKVLEKIKELKDVKVLEQEIAEVKEVKKMWSTFMEIKIELKDMQSLIAFSFNFMPSSIEIIEPKDFTLKEVELSEFLNELLRRLHNYSMTISNLAIKNKVLEKKLQDAKK